MDEQGIKVLVERYNEVSLSVSKLANYLIKEQMDSEITSDQYYTLKYINQLGSCTSSHLADVFEVKKSAITAIINRMWEKGFIQRTRDEEDRRVVYLTLTAEGQNLYHKLEKRIYQLVKSFITKFDNEEIQQFLSTYEKLNDILLDLKKDKVEKQR